jgi:hypothetical protein
VVSFSGRPGGPAQTARQRKEWQEHWDPRGPARLLDDPLLSPPQPCPTQ